MLAFLNLDVQELTVLLFFGWLVIMPLIVGIVALAGTTVGTCRERCPMRAMLRIEMAAVENDIQASACLFPPRTM